MNCSGSRCPDETSSCSIQSPCPLRRLQHHLEITVSLDLPFALPRLALALAVLVDDHVKPYSCARHADVGDAAVPVILDVGEPAEDDDVIFEALEACEIEGLREPLEPQ